MKITTCWPQDTWNVNIWSFGWEVWKHVNCQKMSFFRRSAVRNSYFFFRISKTPYKLMKITTSWPQDTWKVNICSFGWEMCRKVNWPKMKFFDKAKVMKIFSFSDFLESLLKWWKPPPVYHRTLEMLILAHLDEIYTKMWIAKKYHFFESPR